MTYKELLIFNNMDENLHLLKSRDLKAASIPDFVAGGVKLSSDILSTEVVVDWVSKSMEKKKSIRKYEQ